MNLKRKIYSWKIVVVSLILISLFYIFSLIKYISYNYPLDSVGNFYKTIQLNNWKYWFEHIEQPLSFISNILLYIDKSFFGSSGYLIVAINFIALVLIVIILSKTTIKLFSKNSSFYSNKLLSFLLFFIIITLFSRLQDIGILWEVEKLYLLRYLFSITALYFLIEYSIYKKYKYLFYSIILTALATISGDSYKIILISFALLVFLLKYRIFSLLLIFLFISLNNQLFLSSYVINIDFINSFFRYLGGIFFDISSKEILSLSYLMGIFMIISLFYFIYNYFKSNKYSKYSYFLITIVIYYIFSTISILVDTNENLFLYRYQHNIIGIIAWCALFINFAYYFKDSNKALESLKYVGIIVVVTLLVYQFRVFKNEYYLYKINTLDIKQNILSTKKKHYYFYSIEYNSTWYPLSKSFFKSNCLNKIKQNRYSIFSNKIIKATDNIGKVIKVNLSKKNIIAYIDYTEKLKSNQNIVKIIGWSYNTKNNTIPKALYIIDSNKRVIGLAISGLKREDVAKVKGSKLKYSGFQGYILKPLTKNKVYLQDIETKDVAVTTIK